MTFKQSAKNAFLSILRNAGAFSIVSRSERRLTRLLILCYHGIAIRDEHEWLGHLYIAPDRFRQRLEILKSHGASVIPLAEGIERLRRNSLPPLSVSITFDDGFYDFYHHALPVLRSFGFPATLYLSTYYSQYRVPIFNLVLDYILWKSGNSEADISIAGGQVGPVSIRSRPERTKVVREIVRWADTQRMTVWEKDALVRQLAGRLRTDYDEVLRSRLLQIMCPEEVAAIAKAGVDVQLHTHRHRTPRDRELFLREIRDNRTYIREYTGHEAVHFCYPSGDCSNTFLPWLREAGMASATTSQLGLAGPTSESLLLPRVLDDSNVDKLDFESWLCGIRV